MTDSHVELLQRITVQPDICHGQACVRGLRYPVAFLLELLSGPDSLEEVLKDYPDLEPDDFRAACAYAARLTCGRRVDLSAA